MANKKKSAAKLPPKYLDSPLRLLAVSVETLLEKAHRTVRSWRGAPRLPLTIVKHNAIGYPGGVFVQGRVMAARRIRRPQECDSGWVNLSRMIRYWLTDEEPYTQVEIRCGDQVQEVNSDEEGYFEATFATEALTEKIEWRLVYGHSDKWRNTGVITPPDQFRHIIVSDIDDTILISNAASLWKMIKTTLFGNVLTREVFDGTTDFYRKLTADGSPMFYVTSSPWNLRGFIRSIFDRNELPKGGFFMTDWGLDKEKWFTKSHRAHKIAAIEKILAWYPDRPIVLLGDSGQKDPEIYEIIAQRYPDRVELAMIRNVSIVKKRQLDVEAIASHSRTAGTPYYLCDTTADMEQHYTSLD